MFDEGNAGDAYSWSTGETSQTVVADQTPETISVLVSNNGCEHSDSLFIDSKCDLFVPNPFKPNGDGINDKFTLIIKNIEDFQLSVLIAGVNYPSLHTVLMRAGMALIRKSNRQ